MEVDSESLENLKCSVCQEYLSCGPIYLLNNGNSVCGRCTAPAEQTPVRIKPYEHLAKRMKFPCKYEQHGCQVKPLFPLLKTHELGCYYRPYTCPASESSTCEWTGRLSELYDHCDVYHSDIVLDNPAELIHENITKTNSITFIMEAYDMLFMIHTKLCSESQTIHHCVRLLMNTTQNATFKYDLTITNHSEFRRTRDVIPNGCLEENPNVINFTKLSELLGPVPEMIFKIEVKLVQLNCSKCDERINFENAREYDSWYCRKCFPAKQGCMYEKSGCTYEDYYNKLVKHEDYYCMFNNGPCYLCEESYTVSTIWHYKEAHPKGFCALNQIYICTLPKGASSTYLTFENEIGLVHCVISLSDIEVNIKVQTPLSSDQLSRYCCKLKLRNVSEKQDILPMNYTGDTSYSDWDISIDRTTFSAKYVHDTTKKYYIHVNVSKKCDDKITSQTF